MTSLLDDPSLSRTLFFPRPTFRPPPPGARDVLIEVEPGVRLHARIHAAPGAIAAVVFFHGNGEVVSDYDDQAARFAEAGAVLAVVDYRGYGRSEGAPSLRTLLGDARPAFEGLRVHLAETALPIVIMGRSLGSACAAELCRALPGAAAGIVLESGFSDLAAFALRRGLPAAVLTDDDRAFLDPLPKLATGRARLLVLHGEEDSLIRPAEGRAAHEASGAADKRFVLLPGRGHNDVSIHPRYWQALAAFIASCSGAGAPPRGPSPAS